MNLPSNNIWISFTEVRAQNPHLSNIYSLLCSLISLLENIPSSLETLTTGWTAPLPRIYLYFDHKGMLNFRDIENMMAEIMLLIRQRGFDIV